MSDLDYEARAELGRRALRAVHIGRLVPWGGAWLANGRWCDAEDVLHLRVDGAGPVPDMTNGRNKRAVLEWAREVTGDETLCVWRRFGEWVIVSDHATEAHRVHHVASKDTEAEAHVALAEWAAKYRPEDNR